MNKAKPIHKHTKLFITFCICIGVVCRRNSFVVAWKRTAFEGIMCWIIKNDLKRFPSMHIKNQNVTDIMCAHIGVASVALMCYIWTTSTSTSTFSISSGSNVFSSLANEYEWSSIVLTSFNRHIDGARDQLQILKWSWLKILQIECSLRLKSTVVLFVHSAVVQPTWKQVLFSFDSILLFVRSFFGCRSFEMSIQFCS